jgi:hypothetical protein
LITLSWPATAAESTLNVTTHGAVPDSGQDATVPFRQAIAAAKAINGPVTLVVPPGRYDFDRASATVRECSNNGSPLQYTLPNDQPKVFTRLVVTSP